MNLQTDKSGFLKPSMFSSSFNAPWFGGWCGCGSFASIFNYVSSIFSRGIDVIVFEVRACPCFKNYYQFRITRYLICKPDYLIVELAFFLLRQNHNPIAINTAAAKSCGVTGSPSMMTASTAPENGNMEKNAPTLEVLRWRSARIKKR